MISHPIKVKMCLLHATGTMARINPAPLIIDLVVCLPNEKCVPMSHDDDREYMRLSVDIG